jgi:hypothetical protein
MNTLLLCFALTGGAPEMVQNGYVAQPVQLVHSELPFAGGGSRLHAPILHHTAQKSVKPIAVKASAVKASKAPASKAPPKGKKGKAPKAPKAPKASAPKASTVKVSSVKARSVAPVHAHK